MALGDIWLAGKDGTCVGAGNCDSICYQPCPADWLTGFPSLSWSYTAGRSYINFGYEYMYTTSSLSYVYNIPVGGVTFSYPIEMYRTTTPINVFRVGVIQIISSTLVPNAPTPPTLYVGDYLNIGLLANPTQLQLQPGAVQIKVFLQAKSPLPTTSASGFFNLFFRNACVAPPP